MNEFYSFAGDNPYYLLVISGPDVEIVDLDERNWADQHQTTSRPGTWYLCHKAESVEGGFHSPKLKLDIADGEKPYYRAKHIGAIVDGAKEIICYGIGKDLPDGTSVQTWLLPNGRVVDGDEVYSAGADIVHGRT